MKLNSVIFHTERLSELREFYEGKLKLPTGTYVKGGKTVPDFSDDYVNYHIGGAMLCFESEDGRTDLGTVVLNVPSLQELRTRLEAAGIPVSGDNDRWLKIKDPEGRSLIIEGEAR